MTFIKFSFIVIPLGQELGDRRGKTVLLGDNRRNLSFPFCHEHRLSTEPGKLYQNNAEQPNRTRTPQNLVKVISDLDITVLRQRSNSEVEQKDGKLSCEEQRGLKKKKNGGGRERN